jgi:tetratricopeptide (TPR) repeat protein
MTSSQWNGKAGLSPLWSETRAWLEFAKGNTDGATALLRPVADREDKIGKGEVELPPREMMGDMLRLANRPAEALQEYRVSLRTDPGRFNTLLHAGEMAETLGRDKEAASDYRLLLRNATKPSPKSDGALSEARAFLSLHETM